MFRWSAHDVLVMVASSAPQQPQYARADVRVEEETAPSYALRFVVSMLDTGTTVECRVTKQLMARAFEAAIAQPQSRVSASSTTRGLRKGAVGTNLDGEVDRSVRGWICGGTSRPPSREQLTKWLLSRMILKREDVRRGWMLRLYSEKEEASGEDHYLEGVATRPMVKQTDVKEELRPYSPPPPPYSPGIGRSERTFSDSSASIGLADDEDEGDGDQGGAVSDNEDEARSDTADQRANVPAGISDLKEVQHRHEAINSTKKSSTTRHECHQDVSVTTKSRYRFEPATARIKSHRRLSMGSIGIPSNAWSEDRQHFELELTQSKRDIEIARERQRKAEAIASLRRKQAIEHNQKKLAAHEQRLSDSRVVKQSIADALEYHDIARRMDSQLKQTRISLTRDQEKLTQSMRVSLGRSGEQWRKGPVLGSGPLSQIEIDVLMKSKRSESQSSMWVYDLHGRRHDASDADAIAEDGVFVAAMKKIEHLLHRKAQESVDLFRQLDLDRSGTLEYGEFEELLRQNKTSMSSEQAQALFRHFDPNRSGAIDYGELLWGFFNRRGFLKRWKQRKTKLSAREVKTMFYKYDRVGRGALSLVDFQLALDDIGFRVSDSEAKLLCLKFDTNQDGSIDYNEFHAFVNEDCEDEVGENDSQLVDIRSSTGVRLNHQPPAAKPQRTSITKNSASGKGSGLGDSNDMDRILAELRALNQTQEIIKRSISSR